MLFKLPQDVYKILGYYCNTSRCQHAQLKLCIQQQVLKRSLVQLLLCIVDTFDYRLLLLI